MNVTGSEWRKLTPTELRLLSTIAYQAGIAIERARLAQESTRLARAEERTRLAREIHDTLAQGLTAIALHIEGALPYLEHDPGRARERLTRALEATRESLEEARRSVLNLRTGLPAGKPLGEALGALARRLTAETGVRVHIAIRGERTCPWPSRPNCSASRRRRWPTCARMPAPRRSRLSLRIASAPSRSPFTTMVRG